MESGLTHRQVGAKFPFQTNEGRIAMFDEEPDISDETIERTPMTEKDLIGLLLNLLTELADETGEQGGGSFRQFLELLRNQDATMALVLLDITETLSSETVSWELLDDCMYDYYSSLKDRLSLLHVLRVEARKLVQGI